MWKAQNSWSSPPTPGSSGQRKRKIQLLPSRRGARLTLVGLCPSIPAHPPRAALLSSRKAKYMFFTASLTDKPLIFPSGSPHLPSLAILSLLKTWIWKREPRCGGLTRPWQMGPVRKTSQLHAPEGSCFLGFYLDPSHLRNPFGSLVESGEP